MQSKLQTVCFLLGFFSRSWNMLKVEFDSPDSLPLNLLRNVLLIIAHLQSMDHCIRYFKLYVQGQRLSITLTFIIQKNDLG